MSKSRTNKQNRLRSQIGRQKNDIYKFRGKKPKQGKSIHRGLAEIYI